MEGTGAVVSMESGPMTFERCSAATNGGAVAVLGGANFTAVSATATSATSFVRGSGAVHVYMNVKAHAYRENPSWENMQACTN